MNKYQDIQHRRNISNSFPILPTIRLKNADIHNIHQNYIEEDTTPSLPTNGLLEKLDIYDTESIASPKKKVNSMDFHYKLGCISDFSIKQNEKIGSCLRINDSYAKTDRILPEINKKHLLPSESDFSKLFDTINFIVTPRFSAKANLLKEGESYSVIIEEGNTSYFKAIVKSKRSPLIVKLKKKKGKIITYTSSIISEPGPSTYERTFNTDYFEIRDKHIYFKYDVIFLALKALEYSEFNITVSFGKGMKSLQEMKRLKRQMSYREYDLEEFLDESDVSDKGQEKEAKCNKNFIKDYKVKVLPSSPMKASELNLRAQNWKMKREKILEKKKFLLERKKSQTISILNKRMLKKEYEKIKIQENEAKKIRNHYHSKWISIIYFAFSSEIIINRIKMQKQKCLRRISMNIKALQIQSNFRRYSKVEDIKDLSLFRARNILLLYKTHTSSLIKLKIYEPHIINLITRTAYTHIVFHKFATYIQNIIRIQRNFRIYLKIKNVRMIELRKLWSSACELILFRKSSNKRHRKRESQLLFTIPATTRDLILKDYYRSCWIAYRQEIKKYISALNTVSQAKVFKAAISHIWNSTVPPFQYLPSAKFIEKMIEDVKKNMKNSNK